MLELIHHFDRQGYPRRQLLTVCAVCLVVWLPIADANAHELEDGFVERSVAVVVRPSEATITYSIGANEITRQQLADLWNADREAEAGEEAPFLKVVGHALLSGMTVEADGDPSILLTFQDRNFQKCHSAEGVVEPDLEAPSSNSHGTRPAVDGAFRYALKGANGVMLNRSTVAPILVRAKRRLVADIPSDELDAEQQFSAEVILP